MAKYKKRPVVIEAMQFKHDEQWPEGVTPWSKAGYQPRDGSFGYIETLEGRMSVMEGDYIITGVKGERYPCKEDIFNMTYEPVDEQEARKTHVEVYLDGKQLL